MNDTILAARDVTKTATFRVEAFQSPNWGPIGIVDADGAIMFAQRATGNSQNQPVFNLDAGFARVDVVTSYVGADGVLIDAAVAGGARGIVSAGTGAGYPTPAEDVALDRALKAGVVVCQSTRVPFGRVPRSPRMQSRGIVTATNLLPWKARILLSLVIPKVGDPEEIQSILDQF
jgi:L-asparaginase